MANQHNAFGGHNRLYGPRPGSPHYERRLVSAKDILGPAGKIRPTFTMNDLDLTSASSIELLSALEYFHTNGIETLYTFSAQKSLLNQTNKDEITASLNILKDSKYGVKYLQYGNENTIGSTPLIHYGPNLTWFYNEADSIMPGTPVYAPSLQPKAEGLDFLTAFYNQYGTSISDGIDVHLYAYDNIEILHSTYKFNNIVSLAKSNNHEVISTEFCGCTWGLVDEGVPGTPDTIYRTEIGQLNRGIANLLYSLGTGIKHVYWSSMPEDIVWVNAESGPNTGYILFHTGLCIGSWAAGNCYDAAGQWRLMAFAIQLMAEIWRDYSIVTPGTLTSPGDEISIISFPSDDTNVAACYAIYYYGDDKGDHPATITAPLGTVSVLEVNFNSFSTSTESSSPGPKTYNTSNLPKIVIFLRS